MTIPVIVIAKNIGARVHKEKDFIVVEVNQGCVDQVRVYGEAHKDKVSIFERLKRK
jgi:hypothetical protein